MRLVNSILLAFVAFVALTGDADGQRKQTVIKNRLMMWPLDFILKLLSGWNHA